jgi:hypothetical protein
MIRRHSTALLTAVKAKKMSKDTPRSDKVSQTEAQIRLFLILFVLSREERWLVSGMERNFWTLSVMGSNNA